MLTDSHIWNGLSAQYTHMTDQFEGRCANFFFRSTIITFSPFSLRQSGWPPLTHYVSKDDLKRLNFLSPKSWDYRCVPPCLIYAVLTVQSRALHMLSKQPLHQATLIAWDVIIFKALPLPKNCGLRLWSTDNSQDVYYLKKEFFLFLDSTNAMIWMCSL